MVTTYRICKTKYAATWFDGEGAFRFGGRWNSRGTRILYTAGSLSLAALELLVHLNDEEILLAYSFAAAEFDESLVLPVEEFRALPKNWSASPPPLEIQRIGDEWAHTQSSVVLEVPTSVLPVEFNYLINVEHREFSKIQLGKPHTFTFDERLHKN
ncbi:MAG TPA: RES domain-containing protein [Pyrinomonadaceae bacterium]|nr:RES domain-containing protein [Pyrinomonadaceae bacterium]